MKRLLAGLGIIAVLSTGGSALSADLLLRAAAPLYVAQWSGHGQRELGTIIRPPAAVGPTDRRAVIVASTPNARDSHVLEFLSWKEQRSSGIMDR
jgi:hypothetical protein